MVVDVNPLTLKTDPVKNIKLEDGDKLHIPNTPKLRVNHWRSLK